MKSGTVAGLGRPNTVAVSTRKADSKHLKVGSVLPTRFVQTGNVPLKVAFIYKNNTLAGDYIISLATFEKNFPPQLQLDSQIFAKLKPGVSAAAGRAAIEPLVKPYPNAELKDNAQYKADQKKQVNQVLVLVYVLLFLAVIIAFIGIVNTMTLSIYERTREIGLLRAVGGSRRQVRSMVRWEAVIIALFGTLLGIALALFFGWAVVDALHDQGFTKFSAAPVSLRHHRRDHRGGDARLGESPGPARGPARRAQGGRAGVIRRATTPARAAWRPCRAPAG